MSREGKKIKKTRKPGRILGFFAIILSMLCIAGVISLVTITLLKNEDRPEKTVPSLVAGTQEAKPGSDNNEPEKTTASGESAEETASKEQTSSAAESTKAPEETQKESPSPEKPEKTTEEGTARETVSESVKETVQETAKETAEETEEEAGETDAYTQYFRSYADERAAKEKVLDQYRNLGVIKGVRNYLNMRSGPSTGHEVTGIIFKNCGVDILEEKDGWLKISSGGAEGFVKKEYVATGDEARQIALDHMSFQAVVIPDTVDVFNENGEFLTKILKGEKYNVLGFSGNLVDVQAVEGLDGYVNNGEVRCGFFLDEAIVFSLEGVSQKRQDIINYALQFYGGKYVWGGHNLETGVDCSGYIYCVYTEKFGIDMIEAYSITQSTVGTTVTEETIKPGDLIFYVGRFQGQIGHVAIYIGNGKILHAANESKGICVSSWKYVPPVIMKNVIGD